MQKEGRWPKFERKVTIAEFKQVKCAQVTCEGVNIPSNFAAVILCSSASSLESSIKLGRNVDCRKLGGKTAAKSMTASSATVTIQSPSCETRIFLQGHNIRVSN